MKFDNFQAVDSGFSNFVATPPSLSTNESSGSYVGLGYDMFNLNNPNNPNSYYFLVLQAFVTANNSNGNQPPYLPGSNANNGRNLGLNLLKYTLRPLLVTYFITPSAANDTNFRRALANANNQLRAYNMRINTYIAGI
ncbi:hypothetical protein EBU94_02070 [bacterium]|nr:hypothetical protein [bacterium]